MTIEYIAETRVYYPHNDDIYPCFMAESKKAAIKGLKSRLEVDFWDCKHGRIKVYEQVYIGNRSYRK